MDTGQYAGPPHPQDQERMPQIYDEWNGKKRRRHRRDYLEEDIDWTTKFYKGFFVASFVLMLAVCFVISLPVMRAAQNEYHWYEQWAVILSFGFTIGILACIHYYFLADKE